ncbi:MurR/RpiR family transcriptional regulator [Proteiniclasticum sp. SCR006]|uniref:MurR/RpiR family transcriptional regulator n=1 Tax=Proteiniclasticum aestuarii TaxID=2817862 RepID=A0A939KKZ8_9CLOT|nr:MurR/RpiR family transcriptional regulator [Proteiniclasticum aestuarii]MBO1265155.1 MurR/RpiR family transcriptional regulator [Proteiniclasticum aestuarii]
MNNVDVFDRISTLYNSFTKSEKRLADYILKERDQIMFMSITELAEKSKVGESGIFRFCKNLGLKGYQEFKISVAQSINSEENDTTRNIDTEILLNDSLEVLAGKVKQTNISALDQTYNLLDYEDLDKAVEKIITADRIRFFGIGSSLITAMEGQNKFLRVTNKAEVIIDSHFQVMTAAQMNEKEVAIIISYSGQTKDSIEVARMAKESGAFVIAITRFSKSPMTAYADVTLLCGANEGPLQGGSLSAKISQLYLLDVLYFEYFKKTFEVSKENKEKTARAVADKLV